MRSRLAGDSRQGRLPLPQKLGSEYLGGVRAEKEPEPRLNGRGYEGGSRYEAISLMGTVTNVALSGSP